MKYKYLIFSFAFAAILVAFYLIIKKEEKKIAYVQLGELYNDFQMKKELESNYLNVQKIRKQQLDSLELELKFLNTKINNEGEKKNLVDAFVLKRENYMLKKQQFEEDDSQMQQQYTSKIQKQLNQYVSDYGKLYGYDYIIGADGSGALMYANNSYDITKQVLEFINQKFKGLK